MLQALFYLRSLIFAVVIVFGHFQSFSAHKYLVLFFNIFIVLLAELLAN